MPGHSGSMSRVALAWLLVLFGLLSLATHARAQDPKKTVVMLVDPRVLPLSRRLEQEIESLGLAVRALTAEAPPGASLEDEAKAAGAVAAIHIAPMGGGDVDMTIVDTATGKTVSWKLVAPSSVDPAGSELIATRIVELLRASLLELAGRKAVPKPAPEARPAPTVAPALDEATPSGAGSLALRLGPALLYTTRFRPGAELQAALTWMPFGRLGLSAAVLAPLLAARLTSPQGSVDLFASQYRIASVIEALDADGPVSLRCSLGVELERLRFEGKPVAPYTGATNNRTAWAPFAGVTPRFRVAKGAYVTTEVMVALAYPTTVVRLAGDEVTDFGRPLGTAALGVEVVWQ